jgi:hypothetical protein
VADKTSKFGSDEWIPELRNLCSVVLKNLQNRHGGQHLRLRESYIGTKENPGIIINEYHASADLLKRELYGDSASKSFLDHHKIAALYIRSFLINQPFYLDIPADAQNKYKCLNTVLSNEYFIIAYLTVLFKGWNEKFDRALQMDAKYKFDFIKLLYRYKKDIGKLDIFSLSNIICLIEKHYFLATR